MNFYDPGDRKFPREYLQEVQMIFSAVDCLLNGEKGMYCSSELTSGLRLYQALRQHGVNSRPELENLLDEGWFETNIFQRNVHLAREFAKDIKAHLDQHSMIITPAPFVAQGWDQTEYLSFWEVLLRTRVKAVCFNENWQYSNGCTFEFAVALDAGLQTFDHRGQPLERDQATGLIDRAVVELAAESFDTLKLRQNLAFILTAGSEMKFAEEQISHRTPANQHHG
jgi:hypothetical protein